MNDGRVDACRPGRRITSMIIKFPRPAWHTVPGSDSARPGAAGSVPRLPPPRPAALGQLELRQTRHGDLKNRDLPVVT